MICKINSFELVNISNIDIYNMSNTSNMSRINSTENIYDIDTGLFLFDEEITYKKLQKIIYYSSNTN
jgi:hypothetical protein